MHVSSRSFVVGQLDHLVNALGRQNCSGDSVALFRANSDRTFPDLHGDTGNNNAVALFPPYGRRPAFSLAVRKMAHVLSRIGS